ncbi:MAG: hypothetical protein AB7O80_18735 [Acetobacteraceae bacterium]
MVKVVPDIRLYVWGADFARELSLALMSHGIQPKELRSAARAIRRLTILSIQDADRAKLAESLARLSAERPTCRTRALTADRGAVDLTYAPVDILESTVLEALAVDLMQPYAPADGASARQATEPLIAAE